MLDLEVVPERSLGNEQWEFVLGEQNCALKLKWVNKFLSNWLQKNNGQNGYFVC